MYPIAFERSQAEIANVISFISLVLNTADTDASDGIKNDSTNVTAKSTSVALGLMKLIKMHANIKSVRIVLEEVTLFCMIYSFVQLCRVSPGKLTIQYKIGFFAGFMR